MSDSRPKYLLDSDVFIAAKNSYYSFSICPGFWDSLIHFYQQAHIGSIDRVKAELLAGRETEDLVQWVKTRVPPEFFIETADADVGGAFGEVMLWVQRNPQYYDSAKAKFATEADGWLVAYAMVHGGNVVTNEQPRPASRNRILLPDVCIKFGVTYQNTFEMLEELSIRFTWSPETHAD